ncbi:MAG: tyrosine--tRNA ligase [Candidatus Heimdallarchaeaceae archaeon]
MSLEKRIKLITKNAEEVILKDELNDLLKKKDKPRAYIGFELSGLVHLGTGIICGNKLKDLLQAGFEVIVFLADWHSWINNKLGADMEKIKKAGEYFKHAFESVGVKGPNVKFIWASDLVKRSEYWEEVIRVAKANTMSRILRTLPIMGRKSEGEMESAYIYYPAMQVADIFDMKIDLACGGMDQRKAHMLARDTAEKLGYRKPSCLHTPLLTGLEGLGKKMDAETVPDLATQIDSKMSKSKPDTCIFIHDSEEEVRRKIKKAHCPAKQTTGNPITEMVKYIIFDMFDSFVIERTEKYGGDVSFSTYSDFEQAYHSGEIHPMDLKNNVARVINEILSPSRKYFEKYAKLIEEIKKL